MRHGSLAPATPLQSRSLTPLVRRCGLRGDSGCVSWDSERTRVASLRYWDAVSLGRTQTPSTTRGSSQKYGAVGAPLLPQVHRLGEGAVAGRIPHGKADPLLAGCVEGNAEFLGAEGRQIGGRDDLRVRGITIAPDELGEFKREGPFHFGGVNSVCAGAFHSI